MSLLTFDDFLFYWFFVSVASFALYSIAFYYCIFKNYSWIVFWMVLSIGPVSQVLSVVFAFILPGRGHIGRVVGLDAMYVVISVAMLVWLAYRKSGVNRVGERYAVKRVHIIRALSFTIPLIPHLLAQMVLTQCDLTMISYLSGPASSGIYSMGHTVSNLAYSVMAQIMAAWSPWVYRRLQNGEQGSVRRNSIVMLALGAYLSCGLMTVAPEVISIFLPHSYEPTLYIIAPLTFSMFLSFVYVFFYDLEYFYRKPHWIAMLSTITALLNITANFIIIPHYGYLSVCYITAASYGVLVLCNMASSMCLNAAQVYNVPLMVVGMAVVLAYMAFVQIALGAPALRYGVMAAVTVVSVFLLRRPVRELLTSMKAGDAK